MRVWLRAEFRRAIEAAPAVAVIALPLVFALLFWIGSRSAIWSAPFQSSPAAIPTGAIQFNDGTRSSGITFVHEDGADDQGYLVGLMGSGLALFDYDNDELIDAYFLNGRALPFQDGKVMPTTANALYRNIGENRFFEVSKPSRSNVSLYSLGAAVADIDNDGFQDVALANFGSVSLLMNCGDGTFVDATVAAGLENADVAFGAGIAFLDADNDGDLDLYVADYVQFDFERFQQLARQSYPYPPGPEQFEHRADHLFENKGDGTLVDISESAGIAAIKRPSMGVVCGDFDGDHDTDIYVCCDARPNLLLRNNGHAVFSQDAELYGAAFNESGVPVGSMGAEPGDINHDGNEDLFVTDYSAQLPIMFKNLGDIGFEDASRSSRAGRDAVSHANWGAGLFDFDNDGDRDLMIGNGHLLKWASRIEQITSYKVRNTLMANNGKGIFENVTEGGGSGMSLVESTRGMGFDDMDNDGDIDCVISNNDGPAHYLENQTAHSNHWVEILLRGNSFNRDGVGARVKVISGDSVQVSERRSGRSYQSHYGSKLHFGLGHRSNDVTIEVNWLGKTSRHTGLKTNQTHLLHQP